MRGWRVPLGRSLRRRWQAPLPTRRPPGRQLRARPVIRVPWLIWSSSSSLPSRENPDHRGSLVFGVRGSVPCSFALVRPLATHPLSSPDSNALWFRPPQCALGGGVLYRGGGPCLLGTRRAWLRRLRAPNASHRRDRGAHRWLHPEGGLFSEGGAHRRSSGAECSKSTGRVWAKGPYR